MVLSAGEGVFDTEQPTVSVEMYRSTSRIIKNRITIVDTVSSGRGRGMAYEYYVVLWCAVLMSSDIILLYLPLQPWYPPTPEKAFLTRDNPLCLPRCAASKNLRGGYAAIYFVALLFCRTGTWHLTAEPSVRVFRSRWHRRRYYCIPGTRYIRVV